MRAGERRWAAASSGPRILVAVTAMVSTACGSSGGIAMGPTSAAPGSAVSAATTTDPATTMAPPTTTIVATTVAPPTTAPPPTTVPPPPNDIAELTRRFVEDAAAGRDVRPLASDDAIVAMLSLIAGGDLPQGPGLVARHAGVPPDEVGGSCELLGDASGECYLELVAPDGGIVGRYVVVYVVSRDSDGIEHVDGEFFRPDGSRATPDDFHPEVIGIMAGGSG